MKKDILCAVLLAVFLLSACGGNTTVPPFDAAQDKPTAAVGTLQSIPVIDTSATPSQIPTTTQIAYPTATQFPGTRTITPLPTIPTLTPTEHPLSISIKNVQNLKLTNIFSFQGSNTGNGITEISTFPNLAGKVGHFLVAIGYESGHVQLIRSNDFEIIHEYQSEPWSNGIAFSPDGIMLAVAYEGFEIRVWNNSTGELIKTLDYPDSNVENVVFSNDGKKIVGQSKTGNIRIWDTESWELLDEDSGLFLSLYPPDKTPIALVQQPEGGEKFINPLLKSVLFTLPLEPSKLIPDKYFYETSAVAYSYDGKYFAKGSGFGWIAIWDTEKQEMVNVLLGHESFSHDGPPNGIYDLAFAPYGYLLASTGIDGTIRLWNVKTGKDIWSVDLGHSISNLTFSPDGRYLIAGDFIGKAYFWNIDQ